MAPSITVTTYPRYQAIVVTQAPGQPAQYEHVTVAPAAYPPAYAQPAYVEPVKGPVPTYPPPGTGYPPPGATPVYPPPGSAPVYAYEAPPPAYYQQPSAPNNV